MVRDCFRVFARVLTLSVLIMGLMMVSRPQAALAAESCLQCLQSCETECLSLGLLRCNFICEQTCMEEGFCPK